MTKTICPACGTPADAEFCELCGLRLRPAYVRRPRRLRRIVATLVVAVVAGALGLAVPSLSRPRVIAYERPTEAGPAPFTTAASGPYGGSGDNARCDQELLVRALESRPDRLRAWAAVLGLQPASVAGFIHGLQPAVLESDTRVTNHSFDRGRAVARQSVLPKGTAVLVDDGGRIVTRCRCGNPLRPPLPTTGVCTGCPAGYRMPAIGSSPAARTANGDIVDVGTSTAARAGVYDLTTTGVTGGCSAPTTSSMTVVRDGAVLRVAGSDGSHGTGSIAADGAFHVNVAGDSGAGVLEGVFAGNAVDGTLTASGCVVHFTGSRRR